MSRSVSPSGLAAGLAVALGCGPAPPPSPAPPPPLVTTCAIKLAPRTTDDDAGEAAPATLPALPSPSGVTAWRTPASLLAVNVALPLAMLQAAIEPKVPRRLAQEHDHDLGIAGRLEYVVDRGPFALHVEGDTLVAEAPLTAHAQACTRSGCYASCRPEARAAVRVPLKLDANYKLHTAGVRIDITRGCELQALGGLVSVDVTPILKGALGTQSRTIEGEIDRQLPDLRGEAAKLWTELQQPIALPLGSCVVLDAEELVQGTASGTTQLAQLRFGVSAHPELRVKCGDAPATARPLPSLRHDAALPELGEVHLAIALAHEAPARALAFGDPMELGAGRARITTATGDARRLELALDGEICGDTTVQATDVAWNTHDALHLVGVHPWSSSEAARLIAARVDVQSLAAAIEHVELPLPFALDALTDLLPGLASGYRDERVGVAATVATARAESATLRDGEPIAVVLLRGSVKLTVKSIAR